MRLSILSTTSAPNSRARFRALALVVGLVAAFSSASAAHAGRVTAVSLTVDPANYVGECGPSGVRFTFTGGIRTNGPTRVQYRFRRSDGAAAPVREFEARRAGSYGVTDTWTLGGRPEPYEGWEVLEVLYPNSMVSARAGFRLQCGGAPERSWSWLARYEDRDGPGEGLIQGSGGDAGHIEPGEIIQVEIRQLGLTFRGEGVRHDADDAGNRRIRFYVVSPSGHRFEFQGIVFQGIETADTAEGTYYRADRPEIRFWWRLGPLTRS